MSQLKCPKCNKLSDSASRVCPYCGTYMGDLRQTPTPADAVSLNPRPKRREEHEKRSTKLKNKNNKYYYKKHVINWAWVTAISFVLMFFAFLGAYVYLKLTPNGQVILARHGRDANAAAYWTVAEEHLNTGAIPKAIEFAEKAYNIDPNAPDIYKQCFLLAEIYETAGDLENAKKTYRLIYTDIKGDGETVKSMRVSAYRNHIRILQSENLIAQAADLMLTAFEKTKDNSFYKERSQIVPSPPTASLPAGPHTFTQELTFISEGGYDIYYALGDETLPEEGILYTEPIILTEGAYQFRAICVSRDLMSDEMTVRYTISLPRPVAPKSNYAPGEYKRPFRVKLRNIGDDPDVRIYYTVDGSRPSENSPEFTDEGILLPSGNVILRAITVNKYGKSSNELQVSYKIGGNVKKRFNAKDNVSGMPIMEYDYSKFIERFGTPDKELKGTDKLVNGSCTLLKYPWGEARFTLRNNGNLLYYLDTTNPDIKGPRGTAIGQSVSDVSSQFRDMGQPAGPTGHRGIYYDQRIGNAEYIVDSDDPSFGHLNYSYQDYNALHTGTVYLSYHIESGRVTRITYKYTEFMQPNIR
ncbi:MAG: FN3 associated domain-containing protein [Eubacteriales bacterium]|nr:FN3 associated domain-containing protein [Eubacteriales bacterium]